jgi:hypothetical protein
MPLGLAVRPNTPFGAPEAAVASPNTAVPFVPLARPWTPWPAGPLLWPRTPNTPRPVTPRLPVPDAEAKTPDLFVPLPVEIARTAVCPEQDSEVDALVELLTFRWIASGSVVPAAATGTARATALPRTPAGPPTTPASSERRDWAPSFETVMSHLPVRWRPRWTAAPDRARSYAARGRRGT